MFTNYRMGQHREIGKRKTIVIVAEGAHDNALQPIRAEYVKEILSQRLGLDTRVTTLGHTQRGGRPCALDRILVIYSSGSLLASLIDYGPLSRRYRALKLCRLFWMRRQTPLHTWSACARTKLRVFL